MTGLTGKIPKIIVTASKSYDVAFDDVETVGVRRSSSFGGS